jgi:SWI/SNF-related matrix-associated actin-dependent regulator of chromatin subfamily A3
MVRRLSWCASLSNPYDGNAIQVLNVLGTQVGHIERNAAAILSPMLDRKQVVVEGVVLSGASNVYSIPISVAVFGAASDKATVRARLASRLVRATS